MLACQGEPYASDGIAVPFSNTTVAAPSDYHFLASGKFSFSCMVAKWFNSPLEFVSQTVDINPIKCVYK